MDERPRTREEGEASLPDCPRPLFWEYDFPALTWETDQDLIIGRILTSGGWEATRWLRARVSARDLRDWIKHRRGRGLSPRQLRFWELVLRLPRREVTGWLNDPGRQTWQQRQGR